MSALHFSVAELEPKANPFPRLGLVATIEDGELVRALICQVYSRADYDWLLLDVLGRTAKRMAQSCVILGEIQGGRQLLSPADRIVWAELCALRRSRQGREALALSQLPAQATIRNGRVTHSPARLPPAPGRGRLEAYDAPMRMADGRGQTTAEMDRYLSAGRSFRERLNWLRDHNPTYYRVFLAHAREGLTHPQIADREAITVAAAQKRYQRAWRLMQKEDQQ